MTGTEVATAGVDELVGEKGPIQDRPRAATVTATTHMITFAISRDQLHQIMDSNQDAADHLKRVLAMRYGDEANSREVVPNG